ncbi:hypothetical protein E2C01_027702 [Portunus trituberculatus]|uniref:Uncharacterized protein n=1 Tax=Portunus trituberculatus TaxID=210409 RepID=A0A5B7EM10_PORTR|nr:hypothetical protein [Portunus trituberculatus]
MVGVSLSPALPGAAHLAAPSQRPDKALAGSPLRLRLILTTNIPENNLLALLPPRQAGRGRLTPPLHSTWLPSTSSQHSPAEENETRVSYTAQNNRLCQRESDGDMELTGAITLPNLHIMAGVPPPFPLPPFLAAMGVRGTSARRRPAGHLNESVMSTCEPRAAQHRAKKGNCKNGSGDTRLKKENCYFPLPCRAEIQVRRPASIRSGRLSSGTAQYFYHFFAQRITAHWKPFVGLQQNQKPLTLVHLDTLHSPGSRGT